jgi:hypothetical protein
MEWRPTFPVPVGARALAVRHLVLLGCNGHGLQRTEDSNEALGEDASSAEASGGAFARRHMRIANTDRACKVGKDGTSIRLLSHLMAWEEGGMHQTCCGLEA